MNGLLVCLQGRGDQSSSCRTQRIQAEHALLLARVLAPVRERHMQYTKMPLKMLCALVLQPAIACVSDGQVGREAGGCKGEEGGKAEREAGPDGTEDRQAGAFCSRGGCKVSWPPPGTQVT